MIYTLVFDASCKVKRNNILRLLAPYSDDIFGTIQGAHPHIFGTLQIAYLGSIDDIILLLRSTYADWRHLPLEQVLQFFLRARILYKPDCSGTVESFLKLIIEEKELDEQIISMTCGARHNFLRLAALDLVSNVFWKLGANAPLGQFSKIGKSEFEAGGTFFCPAISAQIEFVLRLITLGSDVHNELAYHTSMQERSILETIILHTFRNLSGGCSCCILSTLHPVARVWLEILYEAGVDLVQYGKEEVRIFLTGYMYRAARTWRILFFTYGPTPEDWEFRLVNEYWDREYDRYHAVQQFWNMVENPERNIPGAWEADFDDASSDSSDISESYMHDWEICQSVTVGDYCRFSSPDS
jgi:hypothetical protein